MPLSLSGQGRKQVPLLPGQGQETDGVALGLGEVGQGRHQVPGVVELVPGSVLARLAHGPAGVEHEPDSGLAQKSIGNRKVLDDI